MAAYLRARGVVTVVVHCRGTGRWRNSPPTVSIPLTSALNRESAVSGCTGNFSRVPEVPKSFDALTASDIVGRFVARRLQIPSLSSGRLRGTVRQPLSMAQGANGHGGPEAGPAIGGAAARFIAVFKSVEASYLQALSIAASRCQVIQTPSTEIPRDTPPESPAWTHVLCVGPSRAKTYRDASESHDLVPPTLTSLNLVGEIPDPVLERTSWTGA